MIGKNILVSHGGKDNSKNFGYQKAAMEKEQGLDADATPDID